MTAETCATCRFWDPTTQGAKLHGGGYGNPHRDVSCREHQPQKEETREAALTRGEDEGRR